VRGEPVRLTDSSIDTSSEQRANDTEHGIFVKYPRNSNYVISDQQALVCSRTVRGYCLQNKMWGDFIVDKVEEIEWDDSCFGKLQIDLDLKSNLESLVSQYSTTDSCFKDILKGKSKGLTILLRGPPGSGKTLTAGK
jgi:hypothetical protein